MDLELSEEVGQDGGLVPHERDDEDGGVEEGPVIGGREPTGFLLLLLLRPAPAQKEQEAGQPQLHPQLHSYCPGHMSPIWSWQRLGGVSVVVLARRPQFSSSAGHRPPAPR